MSGYSGTPLAKKLGIVAGSHVLLVGSPEGYLKLLEPRPEEVEFVTQISPTIDIIHFFSTRRTELAKALNTYRDKIKPTCVVWVSWPKKAAKVATDITENTVREVALPLGFVDIKVCAVNEIWSGLKLVIRKELR